MRAGALRSGPLNPVVGNNDGGKTSLHISSGQPARGKSETSYVPAPVLPVNSGRLALPPAHSRRLSTGHPIHAPYPTSVWIRAELIRRPSYRRRSLASALIRVPTRIYSTRYSFATLHATQAGKPVYEQNGWMAPCPSSYLE